MYRYCCDAPNCSPLRLAQSPAQAETFSGKRSHTRIPAPHNSSKAHASAAHSTPARPWIKATLFFEGNKTGIHRMQAGPATAGKLLPRFEIGSDQSNLVDAGTPHDVDRSRNIAKPHRVISFDEGDLLGALLEDIGEARPERVPSGVLIVDLQFPGIENLHDDRLLKSLRLLLLVWRRGLWHQRVQTFRRQRRDHHEDDNQNQENIDQGYDVHRRHRTALFSNVHSHCRGSLSPIPRPDAIAGTDEQAKTETRKREIDPSLPGEISRPA